MLSIYSYLTVPYSVEDNKINDRIKLMNLNYVK
jgi:hypothetical protein